MLGEKNLVTLLKEVQRLYAITSSPEITVELNLNLLALSS